MGLFDWLFRRRHRVEPTPPPASHVQIVAPAGGTIITYLAEPTPPPASHGVDPRAFAIVQSLMREAWGLPIGSVREHAVAHVKVDQAPGGYFLNGKRASLQELRREFARLGRIGGAVFYYKGITGAEMPPGAEAVLAAICEARLPLRFVARDYDPEVKVEEYQDLSGDW